MSDQFLIEKRGFYYRPNAQGYTGRKSEAGRYSFEEAAERVGPNGPDGPQDGLGMWREEDAPDHSSRCPWDIKLEDRAYRKGYDAALAEGSFYKESDIDALQARIAALEAERDDLAREVAAYEAMKLQADAAGGPGVMRRQMELRRYKVRAEAAEAERDKLREYMLETSGRLHQLATDTSGLSPRDMRSLARDMCEKAQPALAETEGR